MFTYENLTVNAGEMFMGYIKDGFIYNNGNELIGRTEKEYQKVVSTAKECEELLYTHGIMERPKTAEQINKEMQEQIKSQSELMTSMAEVMTQLKNEIKNLKEESDVKKSNKTNTKNNVEAK